MEHPCFGQDLLTIFHPVNVIRRITRSFRSVNIPADFARLPTAGRKRANAKSTA